MQKNDTGVRNPVYVEHRYLAALRAARRPLVYPSWYEGFGLPVTQAMACGCPVVVSRSFRAAGDHQTARGCWLIRGVRGEIADRDVENLLSPRRCAPNSAKPGSDRRVCSDLAWRSGVGAIFPGTGGFGFCDWAWPLRLKAGVIHKPGEPPEGGCKLKLAPHRLQALGWPAAHSGQRYNSTMPRRRAVTAAPVRSLTLRRPRRSDVPLYGGFGDPQILGDLLVAHASHDQAQHFRFAARQIRIGRAAGQRIENGLRHVAARRGGRAGWRRAVPGWACP